MKDCNLTCFVGLILIPRVRVGFELTITVSSRSASGKNAAIMISSLITKGRTFLQHCAHGLCLIFLSLYKWEVEAKTNEKETEGFGRKIG